MAASPLGEIEELALCSCCKRTFDELERAPKLLECKHHFCLACVRTVLTCSRDVHCMHCWKTTEVPDGSVDALPTHGAVLALALRLATPSSSDELACATHALPALWCCTCGTRACLACAQHAPHTHALRPAHEARALLARDARDLHLELEHLAARRRDLLLRALDAATALKLRLEAELAAPTFRIPSCGSERSLPAAAAERERLRAYYAEELARSRLDDLVRSATALLDFEMMRRAVSGASASSTPPASGEPRRDPLLLLANYCAAQMFARHAARGAADGAAEGAPDFEAALAASAGVSPLARGPTGLPLFYFELELNGAACGRVVVEVREDVAPRMARNFAALATGELGMGYRGCAVFQCWAGESVITGDFELNTGRGGRSAFEESYFMPDDTRLAAVRGALGMRRSQRRHDNQGLVGSQFRIVLREMRGFTAIFAFVVEGLELVDRLSHTGDSAGKPHGTILIASCGKLN